MAMCAYLGVDAAALRREPPFVRVLAFDNAGRTLLREAKRQGKISLLNAGERSPDRDWGELERRADGLYALFRTDGGTECGMVEAVPLTVNAAGESKEATE